MRKILLTLILTLVGMTCIGQVITSTIIKNNNNGKAINMVQKAGSCGSPDGSVNVTIVIPPNYVWLQANGYCNPSTYGTNPTVCWTFTPTSSSVTLNSGYSTSGCNNISHGPFNLYDASCNLIGSGLSFTGLVPNVQYVWCMTSSAWGGGPSCIGFTDYCPYYFNNTPLPIELEFFNGLNIDGINQLSWITVSEINNDYFTLERSRDAKNWNEISVIHGSGNSNTPIMYEFNDDSFKNGTNYYRLSQTDFDGKFETFDMISITTPNVKFLDYYVINLLGEKMTDDINQHRIIIWEDNKSKFIPAGWRTPKRTN